MVKTKIKKKKRQRKLQDSSRETVKEGVRRKEFFSQGFFLWVAIISYGAILILLVLEYAGMGSITGHVVKVDLEDQCAVIAGRLIHQIRDLPDCELQCKNVCRGEEKEYAASNFTIVEDSCHLCDCYCK